VGKRKTEKKISLKGKGKGYHFKMSMRKRANEDDRTEGYYEGGKREKSVPGKEKRHSKHLTP